MGWFAFVLNACRTSAVARLPCSLLHTLFSARARAPARPGPPAPRAAPPSANRLPSLQLELHPRARTAEHKRHVPSQGPRPRRRNGRTTWRRLPASHTAPDLEAAPARDVGGVRGIALVHAQPPPVCSARFPAAAPALARFYFVRMRDEAVGLALVKGRAARRRQQPNQKHDQAPHLDCNWARRAVARMSDVLCCRTGGIEAAGRARLLLGRRPKIWPSSTE